MDKSGTLDDREFHTYIWLTINVKKGAHKAASQKKKLNAAPRECEANAVEGNKERSEEIGKER